MTNDSLADRAQTVIDVMLLGVRDHLELWDLQQWKAYWSDKSGDYDSLAESALK